MEPATKVFGKLAKLQQRALTSQRESRRPRTPCFSDQAKKLINKVADNGDTFIPFVRERASTGALLPTKEEKREIEEFKELFANREPTSLKSGVRKKRPKSSILRVTFSDKQDEERTFLTRPYQSQDNFMTNPILDNDKRVQILHR